MSLVLAAVLVGGGALLAGVAGFIRKGQRASSVVNKQSEAAALPAAAPTPLRSAGFEIELGDVIEVSGRELWLEQAWLLSEANDPVAAVFEASEAIVLSLPPPASTLYLLEEVSLPLPEETPSSIESRGVRFERVRRLPVQLTPLGKSVPLPWNEGLLSEYRGLGGDALWVLGRGKHCRVWQGRALLASDVVRWGGGAQTLE